MGEIRIIDVNKLSIIVIDYSNCKEREMIELVDRVRPLITEERSPILLLSNFHNTYVTPAFMRHAEKEVDAVKHLIVKSAFIGLNTPKKMILKGFNLFLNRDYRAFESEQEAIDYLVTDTAV